MSKGIVSLPHKVILFFKVTFCSLNYNTPKCSSYIHVLIRLTVNQ